jgi:hypothetical protein
MVRRGHDRSQVDEFLRVAADSTTNAGYDRSSYSRGYDPQGGFAPFLRQSGKIRFLGLGACLTLVR